MTAQRPTPKNGHAPRDWRTQVHEVIFEADTRAGKLFDVCLLVLIGISILLVMLESVQPIRQRWGTLLSAGSLAITLVFTVEYVLRIVSVKHPLKYVLSFFGIVDLLAILPGFLVLAGIGGQSLTVFRSLRLLRVFHIFKLGPYVAETQVLLRAIRATRAKIVVFMFVLLTCVLILGTLVYVVENPHPDAPDVDTDFTSIPRSLYWAIVTITTVGYGDMTPKTVTGQFLSAVAMLLGYSIIIVPVAIFSVEVIRDRVPDLSTQSCPSCLRTGHDSDSRFCKFCGEEL